MLAAAFFEIPGIYSHVSSKHFTSLFHHSPAYVCILEYMHTSISIQFVIGLSRYNLDFSTVDPFGITLRNISIIDAKRI